jgi:hypothetical protein
VNGADCVRQITVAYIDSITPEGVEVPLTPGLATVYHYDTGYPGDDVREVVPPGGWAPVQASDEELKTYGFPPRPLDPDLHASWTMSMSGYRSALQGAPQMCETNVTTGVGRSTSH